MFLLESTYLSIGGLACNNLEIKEFCSIAAASAWFSKETVAVAAALLDCVQKVVFSSLISLVAVELELAHELWVAWHLDWSNNFVTLLNDDIGSWTTEPVNEITESEVFFTCVFMAVNSHLILRCSGSGHADASANEWRFFWDFTDFSFSFLKMIDVVLCEESTWWWADAISALDFLFNCKFMLSHSKYFIY